MPDAPQGILHGWKEIATYLGREVRTVQRWEKHRSLPVRRVAGTDRGNVYALTTELDQWLQPSQEEQDLPSASEVADVQVTAPSVPPSWRTIADGQRLLVRRLPFAIAALVAVLVAAFWSVGVRSKHTANLPVAGHQPYVSKVAGVEATYLHGMYEFGKRTPESLLLAEQLLAQATQQDPADAPAWSGLAQTSIILFAYGVRGDLAMQATAVHAAQRALVLDPGLAEPHAVLGFSDFFWQGQPQAGEQEFRLGLKLNADSAVAHSWYATMLTYEARYAEALAMLDKAQRLDPFSTPNLADKALALGLSGHRDEAVQMLRQATQDKTNANIHYDLSLLALIPPRKPLLFLQEEWKLNNITQKTDGIQLYAAAQRVYLRGGEAAMWRFLANHKTSESSELIAGFYTATGDMNAAFAMLIAWQQSHPACVPCRWTRCSALYTAIRVSTASCDQTVCRL